MATRYQYYNTGADEYWGVNYNDWYAQSFTPAIAHKITSVKLLLHRRNFPGGIDVSIRATDVNGHPTGGDLCAGITNGNTLPELPGTEWREITLGAGANLAAGTKYVIFVRALGASGVNWLQWHLDRTAPTYVGGCFVESTDAGVSWSNDTDKDFMFEEWGVATVAPTGTTDPATIIADIEATLNGTVTGDGGEPCEVRFQYGLTAAYGTDTAWQPGKHAGDAFSQVISGLTPDTTYHFRAQIKNSAGTVSGADRTFTTEFFPTPFLRRVLRDVFGAGLDISAANPLPVDTTAGVKVAAEILDEDTIIAGATTVLGDCAAIDLSDGDRTLTISLEATYDGAATQGIKIHVRTSYDGTNWDTIDWDSWTSSFTIGATIRQTKHYDVSPMYIKVLVENLDPAESVTAVKIIAVTGP